MHLDAAVHVDHIFDDGATASYTSDGDNIAQSGGADGEIDVARSADDVNNFPDISININVTSTDLGTTDETYFARVDWSADDTFSTVSNASPNFAIVPGPNFNTTKVLDRFARLVYVLGGTTPILVVEQAFISSYSQ